MEFIIGAVIISMVLLGYEQYKVIKFNMAVRRRIKNIREDA